MTEVTHHPDGSATYRHKAAELRAAAGALRRLGSAASAAAASLDEARASVERWRRRRRGRARALLRVAPAVRHQHGRPRGRQVRSCR